MLRLQGLVGYTLGLRLLASLNGDRQAAEWVAIAFTNAEAFDLPACVNSPDRQVGTLHELAGDSSDWVAVIRETLWQDFLEASQHLMAEFPAGCERSIGIVLPWRQAPPIEVRNDGPVSSAVCSAVLYRELLALRPDCSQRRFCYDLLWALINSRISADCLIARTLPWRESPPLPPPEPGAIIMAHRGLRRYLDAALRLIETGWGGHMRTCVGLDVDNLDDYRLLAEAHPAVELAGFQPAPLGPYVIRQYLAENTTEPLMIFHDSDDVSCSDRIPRQRVELLRHGCDFVGCHELRVDEVVERVTAFRFPLDVTGALREMPGHSLLHGTGMIRRESFFRAGGLSTDQRVANDTQFLFRAYFNLSIRNADAFLYVRRRHPASLTEHPQTSIALPLRTELDRAWRADFYEIKKRRVAIETSSLRQMRRTEPFSVIPLGNPRAQAAGVE